MAGLAEVPGGSVHRENRFLGYGMMIGSRGARLRESESDPTEPPHQKFPKQHVPTGQ